MERYLTKKNDTIVVNKSNETITIETLKKGGIDSIKINDANVKFEDLTFNQKETSLNITVKYSDDTTQDIIVKDYFTDTNHTNTTSTVKNIILNGEKYSILDLGVITSGQTSFTPNKKGIVTGTTFNDTIDLNTSEINLVVKAGKGNDTITTGRGDDKIYAQYGNNTITAGTGNDKIYSGKGNDTFIFNKGDGEDTIYSSHMGDTLKFDSAPDLKNGYSKVNNDLVISYGSSDKVTVSNYFKQKEGNAMEIESNAIINVTGRKNIVGSYLNDNITGSETNDKIYTGNGNDTITADKGNDTIYLGTGEKTINIKSGDGDDTIIFQSKDISNTSVKLVFDTTDTTDITYGQSTNGKDLYIIRGTEKTIIKNYFTYKTTPNIKIGDNALNITSYEIVGDLKKANKITDTALNDTITGGNKNDTITLSNGGEDSISLLNGNDTVIVENGYSGTAEITSDSGNDTLKFENMLVNVSKSNFNTTNDGTDLVIGNITYKNIRKNTVGRTLKIVDAQKTTTIINNIKEGKISGTNGNDIIFASEGNNTITTTKGDDIIFLNKGDNTVNLSGNFGNDTLYLEDSDTTTIKLNTNDYKITPTDEVANITTANSSIKIADFDDDSNVILETKDKTHIKLVANGYEDGYNTSDTICSVLNDTTLIYKSGNDSYYGSTGNQTYDVTTTIDKTTLSITDFGGNDTLKIYDNIDNLSLYFNIELKDKTDPTSYIYKGNNFNNLIITGANDLSTEKLNNTDGKINITSYFKDGYIENLTAWVTETNSDNTTQTEVKNINLADWVNYVALNVAQFLSENNYSSVQQVIKKGGDDATKLLEIFKDSTYANYQTKQNDIDAKFANAENFEVFATRKGDNLIMYNIDHEKQSALATIDNYFINYSDGYKYQAKDASNIVVSYSVDNDSVRNYIDKESIKTENGTSTLQATTGSDYINLSELEKDVTVFTNGGNDVIFSSKKDSETSDSVGNNIYNITQTDNKDVVKVYDYDSGNDTYNTTLSSALYIEDNGGNDVLNINDENVETLTYIFDVKSGCYSDYTFYTDLFMVDKNEFPNIEKYLYNALNSGTTFANTNDALQSLNGKFGYAWIDDYYEPSQKIETIKLNGKEVNTDYNSSTDLSLIKQNIAAWLTANKYQTAWQVIDNGNTTDMGILFALYNGDTAGMGNGNYTGQIPSTIQTTGTV